jgi:hypothetical protein
LKLYGFTLEEVISKSPKNELFWDDGCPIRGQNLFFQLKKMLKLSEYQAAYAKGIWLAIYLSNAEPVFSSAEFYT